MNKVLRKNSGGYKMTSRLVGRMPSHGEDARCRNMTARKREGIKQMRRFLVNDLMDEMNDLALVSDYDIEQAIRKSMFMATDEDAKWEMWEEEYRRQVEKEEEEYRLFKLAIDELLPIGGCPDCGSDMCDCHVYYY